MRGLQVEVIDQTRGLERERAVHAAPDQLVLAAAHVVKVTQGVGGDPGVVDLRADGDVVRDGVRGRDADRRIRQLRAGRLARHISAPGIVAEAERSGRSNRQLLNRLEIMREAKREVQDRRIVAVLAAIVPVGGCARRDDRVVKIKKPLHYYCEDCQRRMVFRLPNPN